MTLKHMVVKVSPRYTRGMNEHQPFFSVIVPAYKVGRFLPQCLDSILNQTYEDFELIVVDDKSPDSVPDIAKAYLKRDSRIKVIQNKQNLGLLHTRDVGIMAASGKYIVWVDGDDYIDSNHLEFFHTELSKHKVDMLCTGWVRDEKDGIKKPILESMTEGLYEGKTLEEKRGKLFAFNQHGTSRNISPNLWAKVIRKELLDETVGTIPYDLKIGEDAARSYQIMLKITSLLVTQHTGYHYVQHPTQMTKNYHREYFENALGIYVRLRDQSMQTSNPYIFTSAINQNICHITAAALCNECGNSDKEAMWARIKEISDNPEVRKALEDKDAVKAVNWGFQRFLHALKSHSYTRLSFYLWVYRRIIQMGLL